MASIAARITILCDCQPNPRLRSAAVLFAGAVFGLAVAAAASIVGIYGISIIEWFLLFASKT